MASSVAKLQINSAIGDYDVYYSQPIEVGTYSIDGIRQHHNDDRQRKYLVSTVRMPLDLNVDFENTIYRKYRCADGMDHILRWILDNDSLGSYRKNMDFVALRGTLQKIFCTPYFGLEKEIYATKFQNVIYFCCIDSPEESGFNDERLQRMSSWGYKFEQYMTSDRMWGNADLFSRFHELEEFCIIVKSNLGKHSLLFKAEIDAMDPAVSGSTAKYIELKTCPDYSFKKKMDFYKRRLLSCWAQCFLVGIDQIIFGIRDENGIVRSLEKMRMSEIKSLGQMYWSTEKCKSFCNDFLNFLKTNVQEDNPAVVYRFYQNGNYIECQKLSAAAKGILPDWYIRGI